MALYYIIIVENFSGTILAHTRASSVRKLSGKKERIRNTRIDLMAYSEPSGKKFNSRIIIII